MQKGIARFIHTPPISVSVFLVSRKRNTEKVANIVRRTARAEFNTVKVLTCTSDLLFITHTAGDDSDYSINVYSCSNEFFSFFFFLFKNGR